MRVLVLGGTRNLGHDLVLDLLGRGHRVTVLNRGVTPDDLPHGIERLRADRSDRQALAAALGRGAWDTVVDFTLYNGQDARAAIGLFKGRIGRYVFISTGQVYLVRAGAPRPAREDDYYGPVIPEPVPGTRDHDNWRYGVGKRDAEKAFEEAARMLGFPVTSLRLPMVNSPRDHYDRILGYLLRLWDGGPLLVPAEPGPPLRHVYGADVIRAIGLLITSDTGKGRAYNLSQDETVALPEFLRLLSEACHRAGRPVGEIRLVPVARAELEEQGLLPACSPFSDTWMSVLDNSRSRVELGMIYMPLRAALDRLVHHHVATVRPATEGYSLRSRELDLAAERAGV
jgi:nucleoside-diphosphate-sugar epimerase